MPAVIRLGVAVLALAAVPAAAVGLGPLGKSGVTDSDRKGFALTLINPYPSARRFVVAAIGFDDETPADRVTVVPGEPLVAAGGRRALLVIARGLAPGETYKFRVCGELAQPTGGIARARVCSKLVARRVP